MNQKKKDDDHDQSKFVCRNRKARHNYEILDELECGIALTGSEVKSIRNGKISIDEAYARATEILTANRELLDRIAAALLERETIDREDLDRLVKDLPLPPRDPTPPDSAAATPSPSAKPGVTPARAPILGAPPAEPAGA